MITPDGRTRSDPFLQDANTMTHVVAAFALQTPFRTVDAVMIPVLAYLADREHCRRCGSPIMNAERVSTAYGPINVGVAALASHADPETIGSDASKAWTAILENRNSRIRLKPGIGEDDLDELSVAIWESIRTVWRHFGGMSLRVFLAWAGPVGKDKVGGVPEWSPTASGPIELEDILVGTGMTKEMAVECARHERDMRAISLGMHGY